MSFDAVNESDRAIERWHVTERELEDDLRSKSEIEARISDLYRNNDLIRAMIEKQIDTIVGSKVILQSQPDWQAMGTAKKDAMDWQKVVEREFHNYADSPDGWISADRSMTFTEMCRQAYRSFIMTGEIFASREWRPSNLGYKTCFNVFSSNRVKCPDSQVDNWFGVELDAKYGEAKAYHIEKAETVKDNKTYGKRTSQRVKKRNKFGQLQIIHIYEAFLPEYPRGISRLACILKKTKQIERFNEVDMEKAIISSAYTFVITSDADANSVASAMMGMDAQPNKFAFSADGVDTKTPKEMERDKKAVELMNSREVEIRGGKMVHLWKDEDMKAVSPPNTMTSSDDFAKGHTRSVANGAGISYELGTGDFKGVNFSGGQLSIGIYEHSANIQRKLYAHKFATMVYRAWLDEAVSKGKIPLLKDANGEEIEYWANREYYARCIFSGSKRIHIDSLKKSKANKIDLETGVTSRSKIVNEEGNDFESITADRGHEASVILKGVVGLAEAEGIEVSDSAKMKLIIDLMTRQNVDTPDEPIDTAEEQATD